MSFSTEARPDEASTASSSFYDSLSSAFSSLFPTARADEGEDDDNDKEEGGDDKEEGDDDKEESGDDKEEEGGDEEGGEEEGGEDEDDDEPEDPMPSIYENCENSKECSPAKHHFMECQERVEAGKGFHGENCVEEL